VPRVSETRPLRSAVLRFRRVVSLVGQLMLVVLANRLAFALRFDNHIPGWAEVGFWQALPWLVAIRGITFIPFRLYEGLWRYTSLYDLRALLGGVTVSSLLFYALVRSPLGPAAYPRSVFVTDALLLVTLLGGIRLTRRFMTELGRIRPGKRVLIFGAGDAGEMIVRDMKNNSVLQYQPVGFVDDDATKVGRRIHGVRVLGTRFDLQRILDQTVPDEVLIAIPGADPAAVRSMVRAFEPFKIPIKTLPNLRDIIDGRVDVGQIRELAVEDLLTRAPIGLDRRPLQQLIAGRRVLVTGAGGSIGSELCRQIAALQPAALVMMERYENSLHAIRLELEDQRQGFGLFPVIGDVTDARRVGSVLEEHRPDIIFHAAAHKHVPLMEENPCEAIKNNVLGTRVLAQKAEAAGVDRFILISTDKAVNPTSVMGASKRVAELVVQAQAVGSGTSFSIVRFGNVLGSNGSVVPRFMDQIRRGGPVTITHRDMRRFFMLIPEAVQLVLHAASQAESGATYVLEMGEQVKLVDMARDLIRLSGFVPDEDIKIEFIGLRPGEKLYEELVGVDEDASASGVEKILCVRSRARAAPDLFARIKALEAEAFAGRTDDVLALMKALIGPFRTPEPVMPPAALIGTTAQIAAAHEILRHDEQPCPNCRTGRARRSRARTIPERIRKEFTAARLFRCDECGWRGWLLPLDFGDQTRVHVLPVPDLKSLDAVVKAAPVDRRRSFSPKNLQG
jgi:FlaA1/EpsC-like NDP-sugar epimerase